MSYRPLSIAGAVCLVVMVTAGGSLVGCDSESSRVDRQVQDDLDKSIDLARSGTEQSLSQARTQLSSAADNASASVATRANAKALLAQTELESARTAQRKIDRLQIELARLVWEANQLGQQISTTNALVAGYRKYDPVEAKANIERAIADATGGPDKAAWFEHDNTTLPTLSAVRAQISRLEGEIAGHQDSITQLTAQRDRINDDAARASQQAQSGHGGNTLESFKLASDLRKKAADLATAIEVEQATLVPLQKDLSIGQAQQAVLEEVIAQLQAQSAALDSGWAMVQQQIGAQSGLAKGILQGDSSANAQIGGSIAAKAQEIQKRIAELQTLREQAIDDAQSAASNYEQAAQMADQLRRDLAEKIDDPAFAERPERKAWTQLRDVVSPPVFQLQQSAAQRTLASLFASQAAEYDLRIMLRNSLAPVLDAAGLTVPEPLQATNLERDREQAIEAASKAYADANTLLENVSEGQRDESLSAAAKVARILTLYGWAQLERQANQEQSADEHMKTAMDVRQTAIEQNIRLPALPQSLTPDAPTSGASTTAPAQPAPSAATPPPDAAPAPSDTPAPAPADEPATAPGQPGEP